MALLVITLKKVPQSLRGDLTKWLQEIDVGVFVGNVNTKVREKLWQRVADNVREGQATMTYYKRNEIGYSFKTINSQREVLDYEGIPLILIPTKEKEKDGTLREGFSNAYKFKKLRNIQSAKVKKNNLKPYVVIDIETDGLDFDKNLIIEIGAVKVENEKFDEFTRLIKYTKKLNSTIKDLTGIDEKLLNEEGIELKEALSLFKTFIKDYPILGYNTSYDIKFLNKSFLDLGMEPIANKVYDLMTFVKKEKILLPNYKLQTALQAYGINKQVPHRALEDSRLTAELSTKVNKFRDMLK
ncbi:3'-5' exonuclease [Peptoniphilus lacrimalis DNF00528]|nr:3'-5' exonuclease [Peptoniphilus lacrimalis DNF00528]